jgi:hypothetical protein
LKVSYIKLKNFRSFLDSERLPLSQVNVLIGANNSGKSSIIRGLHQLQKGLNDPFADIRIGSDTSEVEIGLEASENDPQMQRLGKHLQAVLMCQQTSIDRRSGSAIANLQTNGGFEQNRDRRFENSEPNHFIVPILSKRKTAAYEEDIREPAVVRVSQTMSNLSAKLSKLSNPEFPAYKEYSTACREILGFVVTTIPSPNGQLPGIYLPDNSYLALDQLGEGVASIVFMLSSLAVSKGKLFLVEEPENDLHPKALKALLALIQTSSAENQFVISTHSNIVVSHLCSFENSQLVRVSSDSSSKLASSKFNIVPRTPEARIDVLQELGYAFSDFDMWDGWLILEESSAEQIIRQFLIPWFTPKLTNVRTVSAGGATNVSAFFSDLNRLILFVHLQPAYAGKMWVRVDGDDIGLDTVKNLRQKYSSLNEDSFATFSAPSFEDYLPAQFQSAAKIALQIQDKQTRRDEKGKLIKAVVSWIKLNDAEAKAAFSKSAKPVIDTLRHIEDSLVSGDRDNSVKANL